MIRFTVITKETLNSKNVLIKNGSISEHEKNRTDIDFMKQFFFYAHSVKTLKEVIEWGEGKWCI